MKKITVVGSGYVGMANAVMLAKYNQVTVLDIDPVRVDQINNKKSTVADKNIQEYLDSETLSLRATLDKEEAYDNPDWVIICTPTDYDPAKNYFNTDSIETVIRDTMEYTDWDYVKTKICIKSTIPVGYVRQLRTKFGHYHILFSPEFLREGSALRDCLRPERIVIGDKTDNGKQFAALIKESIIPQSIDPPVLFVGLEEAESIKLFANTYLAMRVAFFNELDMYAEATKINAQDIIQGITTDTRIGKGYSNPSFGYGGYCFPKDTKQLLANFRKHRIPNKIIQSVVYANENRKDWITNKILQCDGVSVVGIYRLIMKSGSDNFRSSAVQGIIERLVDARVKVIVYEPELMCYRDEFMGCVVERDLNKFKKLSDLIVTNRLDTKLADVLEKTYTRDIFNDN